MGLAYNVFFSCHLRFLEWKIIPVLPKKLKCLPFAIIKTAIFWNLNWNQLILECMGEPAWYSKCWLNLIPMCGYCVCSVMSDSLWPHGLQPARLLHPWDFPGKNMGVDCHFLLLENFLTQGLNPGLPHYRQTLYYLSHWGSIFTIYFALPSLLHLRPSILELRKFSPWITFLKFFLKNVFLLLVW